MHFFTFFKLAKVVKKIYSYFLFFIYFFTVNSSDLFFIDIILLFFNFYLNSSF